MFNREIRSKLIRGFGDEAKIFHLLEEMKKEVKEGEVVYDLTIGSPDGAPNDEVVETMQCEVAKKQHHRYAGKWGNKTFNEAVAKFYKERYKVELDPKLEVVPLAGAKRAIIDMAVNFVNEGQGVLLPDMCYPTYRIGAQIARAKQCEYRLDPENEFKPIYEDLDRSDCDMIYLNYPHNPTCSYGGMDVFEEVIKMAKKNDYIVCHDNAYGEIVFDNRTPISFLQAEGAKDVGVEIFTFSKIFDLAGWRLACIVGNPEIVHAYGASLVDYTTGVYTPVQLSGAKALELFFDTKTHEKQSAKYQERRDVVVKGLNAKGWKCFNSQGSIYVWAELPVKDCVTFTKRLWEERRVLITTGITYGPKLGNYVRLALVSDVDNLKKAIEMIPDTSSEMYDC
jgi:aspartate/methionine/tyrosine aminotransferase